MNYTRLFLLAACAVSGTMGLCAADRTKEPQTPPLPNFKLPPVTEFTLANGLTVVVVEQSKLPLVTARLLFQGGAKTDPQSEAGLSEAVASLLTEGTKTRSSRQIAEETASLGGSISANSSSDNLTISGGSLAENFPKLLALMADVARNANFPQDEIQLYQQNRKQGLLAQRSQAEFQASEKFGELLYGTHPYARNAPAIPTIDGLTAARLAAHRDAWLAPNNASLILLGQLPPRAQLQKLVKEHFDSWQKRTLAALPEAKFPESKRQVVLVDRPGSAQADVRIGRLAVTRADPDHFPLLVGNTILGGGASSRLFMDIRETKGYAYSVGSMLDRRKDAGAFTAFTQVRNEVLEPAISGILANLDKMASEPVSAKELSDTKNYVSGNFVIGMESQEGLAGQLTLMRSQNLPKDYLETFVTRIRSTEPDQIQKAAAKYIKPDNDAIVVVGDAKKIGAALEKFGKVEVTSAK